MAYNSKFTGQEIDEGIEKARAIPEGGISGKRTCRFVIGTSTAGWTASDCDYLCDGTADDVEINAAIQALPATGGQILILDGTYKITAPITFNKNGATLCGNGAATILQRNWDSARYGNGGVITINAVNDGVTVRNIQIDGNAANYTATGNHGIYITSGSNNIINNICNNNSKGIYLSGANSNNTITGNTCNNNTSSGISLSSSDNNTVTGNTCNNNSGNGVIVTSNNTTITGNTCNNNATGIYLSGGNNNTVTGNTCIRGTGQASDYTSSQKTIYAAQSSNNLIVGNNIMGKNYVDSNGTGNTWANNKYN